MVRRVVTMFLMLAIGWQSLAYAGFDALAAHEAEKQHELLHFKGVAHHHDEHGEAFHEDDSMASTMHVLSDSGQFSPVLPSAQGSLHGMSGADQPAVNHLLARALLMPGGLYRPPKLST